MKQGQEDGKCTFLAPFLIIKHNTVDTDGHPCCVYSVLFISQMMIQST